MIGLLCFLMLGPNKSLQWELDHFASMLISAHAVYGWLSLVEHNQKMVIECNKFDSRSVLGLFC